LLLAFVFLIFCSLFSKNAQKNGFQNYELFSLRASFFFKILKIFFSSFSTVVSSFYFNALPRSFLLAFSDLKELFKNFVF